MFNVGRRSLILDTDLTTGTDSRAQFCPRNLTYIKVKVSLCSIDRLAMFDNH